MRTYTIAENTVTVRKKSLNINDKLNERTTCSFVVIDPDFEITKGMEVLIQDDSTTIFKGKVFKPKSTGYSVKEVTVSCVDYSMLVDKRIIAEAYENELAGDIVKDFITKYFADEGITEGTIQDGPTIEKAVFNYKAGNVALNYLSDLTGFFWEVDQDKKLNFFDKSTYEAPFSLTDTSLNYNDLTIEEDASDYRNRQYLRAGNDISTEQTRTFKGDGETQVFTVDLPIALAPTVTVDGVAKTVGIRGLETGFDWYWQKNDKSISQDSGGTKLTSSNTLSVVYQGYYPIIIVADSTSEIASRKTIEGGSGIYESVDEETNLDTKNSALDYTNGLLNKYGFIPKVVSFNTHVSGLKSGQLLSIQNTKHNIDGDFLIKSVTTRDNGGATIYSVQCLDGSKLGGWEKFFQALINSGKKMVIRENEILVKLIIVEDVFALPVMSDTMTYDLHQYNICGQTICGTGVIL